MYSLLAATDVQRQLYHRMLLSTKIGTAAFGNRKDFTISRLHGPMKTIMDLSKGGGPVANCECNLQELTIMQQEVKVRV